MHRRRPAETGAAGVGVVVVALLTLLNVNLSDAQLQALLVCVAAVPAAITFVVELRRKRSA